MTGLVLRLRPYEKLLINGAILQNGSRATRLRVRSTNASVLRLRDAIPPAESFTALERIYYVAQLAVAGEADSEQARLELVSLIEAAAQEPLPADHQALLSRALAAAEAGKTYSVMRAIRPLIAKRSRPEPGQS